jgi:hypothetical protein
MTSVGEQAPVLPVKNVRAYVEAMVDDSIRLMLPEQLPALIESDHTLHWLVTVQLSAQQHPLTGERLVEPLFSILMWIPIPDGDEGEGHAVTINLMLDVNVDDTTIMKAVADGLLAIEQALPGLTN